MATGKLFASSNQAAWYIEIVSIVPGNESDIAEIQHPRADIIIKPFGFFSKKTHHNTLNGDKTRKQRTIVPARGNNSPRVTKGQNRSRPASSMAATADSGDARGA